MIRPALLSLVTTLLVLLPCTEALARAIPVNVVSVPAGATVYLDSTATPLGQTPLRNVRIERGRHVLIFQLRNHEEARLNVRIRRRRETFRASLRGMGTIEVSMASASAQGARVEVDGRAIEGVLGPTPIRVAGLQPGRHQVRVLRDGYRPFEQWVQVGGGELVRMAAVLERAAAATGSVLVSGPSGSPVFVDGNAQGATPTVVENVSPGAHTVEIRVRGRPPYRESVTVVAGQRATVAPQSVTGSSLRVVSVVPNAVIAVDGENLGSSPATATGLTAGEHIISATADGYQPLEQTVTVEADQQRVVSLELQPLSSRVGRIIVRSNVENASVVVDNEEHGGVPAIITPEAGPHAVVVRADGHQAYRTTCDTAPGQNCEIQATLVPQLVRVRVAVQPGITSAQLVIDSEPVGPVPYDGTLPAGSHLMQVTAPDYDDFQQQVLLQPSDEVRQFDVVLSEVTDGLTPSERLALAVEIEDMLGGTMTHAAAPLPRGQASIDLSLGWPYLGEVRLNVGLHEFVDAGVTIRSIGRLTEIEGRARVGFRPLPEVSVGGQFRVGGGIGRSRDMGEASGYEASIPCVDSEPGCVNGSREPAAGDRDEQRESVPRGPSSTPYDYPTNSVFLSIEGLASLHFGEEAAATLWVAMDVHSDEYAGHPLNSSVLDSYCEIDPNTPSNVHCDREGTVRARLGGSIELRLHRHWNLWALFEGILNAAPRRVLGNLYGIQDTDQQYAIRLGTTYKF